MEITMLDLINRMINSTPFPLHSAIGSGSGKKEKKGEVDSRQGKKGSVPHLLAHHSSTATDHGKTGPAAAEEP